MGQEASAPAPRQSIRPRKTGEFGDDQISKRRTLQLQLALADDETCPLLNLPKPLRLKIWKLLPPSTYPDLRLTCPIIKHDIDHEVGIRTVLNDKYKDFTDRFTSLGIQQAVVSNLSGSPGVKLRHPELLTSLIIHGPISSQFLTYFIDSCPNLACLSVTFTKLMLISKPELFSRDKRFRKLRVLRVVSNTKKEDELIYVCNSLTPLLYNLINQKGMMEVDFRCNHKRDSPYLYLLALNVFLVAFHSAKTLEKFGLQVREFVGVSEEVVTTMDESGTNDASRRLTGMPGTIKKRESNAHTSESHPHPEFPDDSFNSKLAHSAEKFFNHYQWPELPCLRVVVLAVNSSLVMHAREVLLSTGQLTHLMVEVNGNLDSFTPNFQLTLDDVLKKASVTLTAVSLLNICSEDENKTPNNIDLQVFNGCKSLRQLHLSCIQREVRRLPKAVNITSLPKSLKEIELLWMTLTFWQWFKILGSFKQLEYCSLAYSTRNDWMFGIFLWVLRWSVVMKWAKPEEILLTDLKIRFRNQRGSIRKLQRAVEIEIQYKDEDETLLVVHRGRVRKRSTIPEVQ